MAVDRIFADGTELDEAQGLNELAEGDLYMVSGENRLLLGLSSSEYKPFYGSGDNAAFADLTANLGAFNKLKSPI